MTARPVGEVLRELIADQLAAERATRASLIQRSTVVITSAGVLVSICLTSSALITRVQTYEVPGSALALIGVAVGLFVAAALLALFINAPQSQASIDVVRDAVKEGLSDWARPDEDFEISTYYSFVQLSSCSINGNPVASVSSPIVICGSSRRSLENPWRMGHRPSPVIRSTFPLIVTT